MPGAHSSVLCIYSNFHFTGASPEYVWQSFLDYLCVSGKKTSCPCSMPVANGYFANGSPELTILNETKGISAKAEDMNSINMCIAYTSQWSIMLHHMASTRVSLDHIAYLGWLFAMTHDRKCVRCNTCHLRKHTVKLDLVPTFTSTGSALVLLNHWCSFVHCSALHAGATRSMLKSQKLAFVQQKILARYLAGQEILETNIFG